jgi:ATP-dependent exoDNAse (exonuclease V) beta subunit
VFSVTTSGQNQVASRLEVRAASAGTGKTTSLVLEYLRALAFVPARRIAAVTFTRVGAVDLRERMRAGLREVTETGAYLGFRPPTPEPYRQALREIGSTTITTIHGFFRDVLRLNAPALGLDPEFSYLDESQARELFRDAASAALARTALEDGTGAALLVERGWEESIQALETLFARRVYAPFQPAGLEDGVQDELTVSLIDLYRVAEAGYTARLASRALGPTDVELETLRLLNAPDALERIRSRYRVLLVDEFQDVNPLQARIFSGLQIERTLLVGDAKQSIYAFRDADVNAFLDVYAQAHRLEPLNITYRHGPELSDFYSAVAARLFPEFTELGLPAEVQPGRSSAAPSTSPYTSVEPRAELHVFQGASLELARRSEARFLADRLTELHDAGTPWSEMAVLVRSRTALGPLEAALAAEGVPALMVSGQRYYDRREIRDAATLLRARLGPDAPQTLAALSQLPGIDLQPAALETMLEDEHGLKLALERSRLPQARRLRELLERLRDATDAIDLLSQAWNFLGPRSFTRDRQSTANLDGLLYQLAARGLRDPRSALGFLERARLAEAEGDEPLEAGESVRLLTVHAAKGLEFGVVAVFDLARGERNTVDDVLVHPDGSVAIKGSEHARRIHHHWNARRDGEANRLLYVALTRARDRLILTGSMTRTPRAWLETLLNRLNLGQEDYGIPGIRVRVHTVTDDVPQWLLTPPGFENRFDPHPRLARARFARPGRRVRAPTRSEAASQAESEFPSEEAMTDLPVIGDPLALPQADQVIGTLTHYAISEALEPDNPTHQAVLAAQYVLHPFSDVERTVMLERAWALYAVYRRMYPNVAARLADHAELPFAFARNGVTWQGVIDRFYQQPDGVWVLEDFKTDDVPPEALSERANAYHRQLALYREAIRLARPGLRFEVRLTFLRHGLMLRLEDDVLDAALEGL